MNATRHIDQEDLALFAMQLLSSEEASVVSTHLEGCPDCQRARAEVQGDLAIYAHTVDLHSPPAFTRERLMKQVAREKKTIPIDQAPAQESRNQVVQENIGAEPGGRGFGSSSYLTEDEPPRRSLAARVLPWIGWAVAAGLAVGAGDLYREREVLRSNLTAQAGQLDRLTADAAAARQVMDTLTDTTAKRVTLSKEPVPPVPQGKATYVPEKGALLFVASNLEPLQPDKVYELWLIPSNGLSPIPAGTFRPDERGNASVILPQLPKGVDAKAFGVTVENEGGSQSPTLPIVLSGLST